MKLKSFNFLVGLLIIFSFSPLASEEKIDIWKNKKETSTENSEIETDQNFSKEKNINIQTNSQTPLDQKIKIEKIYLTTPKKQNIWNL